MNKFLAYSFIVVLTLSITLTPAFAQTRPVINWLQICSHPLIDGLVVEPCESLASPDGYQLTEEGKRVLICLLGGSIAKLFRFSNEEISLFAPVAGCGAPGILSEDTKTTGQGELPRNTQDSLNLPPDTRVTDIFQIYVTGTHGNKVIVSIDIPDTSSRLEETDEISGDFSVPFYFYAGFAPLGTPVKVCVKDAVNNRENCQSFTHTVNPELVNITSP